MIAIVHPVVRQIRTEYDILRSLINDLPSLYEGLANEIENHGKEDASAASDGDSDIYDTVYHSYNSAIDFAYEVPDRSRGYILAAIYSYYERNVQNVFKRLNIPNYEKEKMTAQNVFV